MEIDMIIAFSKYFYELKLHINLILIDENSYFHKLKTMYDCITK